MTNPSPILLVTRPAPDGQRFVEALGAVSARPILSPLLRIQPLAHDPVPEETAHILLTSANAVPALAGIGGVTLWCVGPRTAEAARALDLPVREAAGTVADLAALIRADRPLGPMVYLRGEHVSSDLRADLAAAGFAVSERVVYRQVAAPLSSAALAALAGTGPVILPLFSPRTARLFASGPVPAAPLHVIAMSPAVAAGLKGLDPAGLTVAASPTMEAMIQTTRQVAASI